MCRVGTLLFLLYSILLFLCFFSKSSFLSSGSITSPGIKDIMVAAAIMLAAINSFLIIIPSDRFNWVECMKKVYSLRWCFFDMYFVPVRKHISGTLRVIPQHINVSKYADKTGMKYRVTVFVTDTFFQMYCKSFSGVI